MAGASSRIPKAPGPSPCPFPSHTPRFSQKKLRGGVSIPLLHASRAFPTLYAVWVRFCCVFFALSLFFFPRFASKLPPDHPPLPGFLTGFYSQTERGSSGWEKANFGSGRSAPGVNTPALRLLCRDHPNGAFFLQLAQAILGSSEVF